MELTFALLAAVAAGLAIGLALRNFTRELLLAIVVVGGAFWANSYFSERPWPPPEPLVRSARQLLLGKVGGPEVAALVGLAVGLFIRFRRD